MLMLRAWMGWLKLLRSFDCSEFEMEVISAPDLRFEC